MLKSTRHTQSETLSTQLNVEESQSKENSSTELVEQEKIQGTPFRIIGNEERGYFLSFGKFRLTEAMHDKLAVLEHVNENMWTIIVQIVGVVLQMDKEAEAVESK